MAEDDDFPRDKQTLIRDFTVAGKLREIRDTAWLRDSLMPKWWETSIGILQFAASLGLLASLVQHPALKGDALLRMIVFWGALALLSLVMGFEFLILKFIHLRRANEILLRSVRDLDQRLHAFEKQKGE